jgi:hypothetical protein
MSEPQEAEERRGRYQRGMAAGAGVAIGVVLGGSAGAVVGAALGPVLEPWAVRIWEELSADGRRRAEEALAAACEALGCGPDELGERIVASERTRLQAGITITAATRTVWPAKVRVLGRALASGLLAEDDATIETESRILAAMADIEAPELSLLELLGCWIPSRTRDGEPMMQSRSSDGVLIFPPQSWAEVNVCQFRPNISALFASLIGILQRHGLVSQDDNTAEALARLSRAIRELSARDQRLNRSRPNPVTTPFTAEHARSLAPAQSWSVTGLGELVLRRYREAGVDVPDGWVSGTQNSSEAS